MASKKKTASKAKTEPKPDLQPEPLAPPVPAPVVLVPETVPPAVLTAEDPVRPPEAPQPTDPAPGLSPDAEIAKLEKEIREHQARIHQLQHPVIEFPKIVKDRRFESREEQDAAGPDFADKK